MKTSNPLHGVVVNCLMAPVHERSNNESLVIAEIGALNEVEIVPEKSIDVFWYVVTPSGEEGYCLKDYIALRR